MKKLRILILVLALVAFVPMMGQNQKVILETTAGNIVITLYDVTPKHLSP